MASARVNREEFLNRLQAVQPGLSAKEVLEQSSCFAFSDGKILTYNEETSCRIPSKLGKDFAGAVQAKPLLDLLGKLTEDEVGLEAADGELIVTGTRRKAGIRMEKDVLLGINAVEDPGEWKPLAEDFAEAVQIVSGCASRDASRFDLCCVHIAPKFVEAGERYQIARYRVKTPVEKDFLVRQEALKQLVSLGVTDFSETPSWVHFKNGKGLVFSCRRYLDQYPDMKPFFEMTGEQISLPGGLNEAISKAEIFSAQNTDDNKVMVTLANGKLKLKGQGMQGWFEETKKIKYDGPAIKFLIAPKLLSELAKKHTECEVSADRLKVTGEKYVYVACLSKLDDGQSSEPQAEQSAEGGE